MDIKWKKSDLEDVSNHVIKLFNEKMRNITAMYIVSIITFLLFIVLTFKTGHSGFVIFMIYFFGILNLLIWLYLFRHLNPDVEKPFFLKWFKKIDSDLLLIIYIVSVLIGIFILYKFKWMAAFQYIALLLPVVTVFNGYSMIFIMHMRDPDLRKGVFIRKTYADVRSQLHEKNRTYQRMYSFEKKMQIETMILYILLISIGIMGILALGVYGFSKRFICFMIVVGSLLAALWVYYHKRVLLSDVATLAGEIHEISEGKTKVQSSLSEDSALYEAGEDLIHVVDNLNRSFQKQVQSEKMKIDLITNVSHDLKTPLTSIIGYVDLLKKMDLDDTARDYVEVISHKSEHLKEMIQDVFEISKATSGTMDIQMDQVDVCTLIRQTMGDMEDRIQESNREIRCKLSETPLCIQSDGGKLYRVFQNLIENALKYSLEGSRIYIDAQAEGDRIKVVIKNVSSYEMDFTEETIVERFSRGDVNRTTEGHGLGLAIVKSFLEACGAEFHIDIDGDLFKAIALFDRYIPEEKTEDDSEEVHDK